MIPNKLDLTNMSNTYAIDKMVESKINELIDYLSDKEGGECSCECHGGTENTPSPCKHCLIPPQQEECKSFIGGDGYPRCSKCGALLLRADQLSGHKCKPVEEESRGECGCCAEDGGTVNMHNGKCNECGHSHPNKFYNPQLKEESPKEDEWEAGVDSAGYEDVVYGNPTATEAGFAHVKAYIKANFVSKVKIKEYLGKAYWMGAAHGVANRANDKYLNDFLSELGLEEL